MRREFQLARAWAESQRALLRAHDELSMAQHRLTLLPQAQAQAQAAQGRASNRSSEAVQGREAAASASTAAAAKPGAGNESGVGDERGVGYVSPEEVPGLMVQLSAEAMGHEEQLQQKKAQLRYLTVREGGRQGGRGIDTNFV